MADCYAPEADDLHRRWLPREIFADIGIADPDPIAAAMKPEVAAAVAVEELAVQLAGIIGAGAGTDGKGKSAQKRAPPPPPPFTPAAAAPCHRAPVCGLEGAVVVAYGGGNVVAGGTAVAWPVTPYSRVQWQVASNYVSIGGAPDYSMLPPAPPCLVPPPGATKLRGGTGVFLPRTDAYRHAPPPAKDGKAPGPRTQQKDGEAAAGKSQQRQNGVQLRQQKATAAAVHACPCPEVALALPQDWSYH